MGSGMDYIGIANIALLLGLFAYVRVIFNGLLHKNDELVETLMQIDISPQMELNAEAMEVQMQAQKQAQIFDFLRSIVQPSIQVKEVKPKDEKGRFI